MHEAILIFCNALSGKNVPDNVLTERGAVRVVQENKGVKGLWKSCNSYKEILVEYPNGKREYMTRKEFNQITKAK
tara:strand:- start:2447 stop:2671 length:225 start_codon:yes stop_codon:yes gene_type:complete